MHKVNSQKKTRILDSKFFFLLDLLGQQKYEELLQLRVDIEGLTGSWLTLAIKALNIIKQR
jgi:hypothetical protein